MYHNCFKQQEEVGYYGLNIDNIKAGLFDAVTIVIPAGFVALIRFIKEKGIIRGDSTVIFVKSDVYDDLSKVVRNNIDVSIPQVIFNHKFIGLDSLIKATKDIDLKDFVIEDNEYFDKEYVLLSHQIKNLINPQKDIPKFLFVTNMNALKINPWNIKEKLKKWIIDDIDIKNTLNEYLIKYIDFKNKFDLVFDKQKIFLPISFMRSSYNTFKSFTRCMDFTKLLQNFEDIENKYKQRSIDRYAFLSNLTERKIIRVKSLTLSTNKDHAHHIQLMGSRLNINIDSFTVFEALINMIDGEDIYERQLEEIKLCYC